MALATRSRPIKSKRTIVFVTFESEFSPVGGLGTVMALLPKHIAQAESECFTITPLFRNILSERMPRLLDDLQPIEATAYVRFGDQLHAVKILKHVAPDGYKTYLLDTDRFFGAPSNPYTNPSRPEQLLQDALFLCAAVPSVLEILHKTENIILCLQDWEAACTALCVADTPTIETVACILVLHNAYDKPLPNETLAQISGWCIPGPTVLTKMMPLLDGPVITVSKRFAVELVCDPLQTYVYASHLQPFLNERGIVGIDNGPFGTPLFSKSAPDAVAKGDFEQILSQKRSYRDRVIEILQADYQDSGWGRLEWAGNDLPIFLMFGRDDPRQKGYDLAAAAIQRLPYGKAKYIFTPIPGDEGLEGLEFLKELAEIRHGEVKILPFRMSHGYRELQQGSSFIIMCSFYEPFGGATEGYAAGTPVVARATGGLVQQVVPYTSNDTNAVGHRLANHYHAADAAPTGFLFREPEMPLQELIADWRALIEYSPTPDRDRLADRERVRLFSAIADEAANAILAAIELYTYNPLAYSSLILSGFKLLERFSWEHTVREYQQVFDMVCA